MAENWFRRFRMEGGVKKHLQVIRMTHVCHPLRKPDQGSEVIQEPLLLKPGILVKKIGRFSKTQKWIY